MESYLIVFNKDGTMKDKDYSLSCAVNNNKY